MKQKLFLFVCWFKKKKNLKWFVCRYILNIYSTFSQYRDNTYIRDNFGHYNRDKTFYTVTFLTTQKDSYAFVLPKSF